MFSKIHNFCTVKSATNSFPYSYSNARLKVDDAAENVDGSGALRRIANLELYIAQRYAGGRGHYSRKDQNFWFNVNDCSLNNFR